MVLGTLRVQVAAGGRASDLRLTVGAIRRVTKVVTWLSSGSLLGLQPFGRRAYICIHGMDIGFYMIW